MAEDLLYDCGSYRVFSSSEPGTVILEYTDVITAFNGIKRANITGKGKMNASIASMMAKYLEEKGIKSHFIRMVGENSILCQQLDIIRMEVVVRNKIAGTTTRKLGVKEGYKPENTIFDLCYKNEDLGDPLINDHYAVALGLVSYDELKEIYHIAEKVNVCLSELLDRAGIELVDFMVEFGRDAEGNIILADALTPDNARFWDKETGEKLDRDRFRWDYGRVGEAYRIVNQRLRLILKV